MCNRKRKQQQLQLPFHSEENPILKSSFGIGKSVYELRVTARQRAITFPTLISGGSGACDKSSRRAVHQTHHFTVLPFHYYRCCHEW
ncbi:hypothetical protein E2C01_091523 [Portunus trituberculatus]|uniref:Uncharacterized protein n=1 Tax=Portunus trituberculatus TaxID=210409 RepID=A0A5B7JPA4_PORTR|nr:hypothetical protein [Portunus trituberculatus]